jgi:hypothetical protein
MHINIHPLLSHILIYELAIYIFKSSQIYNNLFFSLIINLINDLELVAFVNIVIVMVFLYLILMFIVHLGYCYCL